MHAPVSPPSQPGGFSTASLIRFSVVTLIWGSTWLIIRSQLDSVPASWSVAWRFLLAGAAMFALCLATGKSLRIGWRGHGFAIVMGVFQFSLNFNLVYRAEEYLTSGLVALAFALLIIPNAVLSWVFLGQRVGGDFVIGSVIGIAGIALLFARDLMLPGSDPVLLMTGIAMALGGVVAASIGNVMQAGSIGRSLPLQGGIAWSMAYGGLFNVMIALVLAGPPAFDLSVTYVAGLTWLALIASAGAFNLYYALIRDIGPGKAAYTGVVVPFVAMAISTVFEGYVWSPQAVAGGVLAAIGLVIALRSRG
jgi:drug/metabolite transporter (DMT)-like permease